MFDVLILVRLLFELQVNRYRLFLLTSRLERLLLPQISHDKLGRPVTSNAVRDAPEQPSWFILPLGLLLVLEQDQRVTLGLPDGIVT